MMTGAAAMAAGISLFILGYNAPATTLLSSGNQVETGSFDLIPATKMGGDVVEFFWYGCSHCMKLEQAMLNDSFYQKLQAVTLKDGTRPKFKKIPAVMNETWELHGRLYFALESFDMSDEGHYETMKAISRHQPSTLNAVENILADSIISGERFRNPTFTATPEMVMEYMMSAAADRKVKKANQLARKARITGVPTFMVNGEKRISLGSGNTYESTPRLILDLVTAE
jgi:protein dithiol oxidoreductase (disulfide-forming)